MPPRIRLLSIVLVLLGSLVVRAHAASTVLEDAETGSTSQWTIYDPTPAGASVDNIVDASLQSRVIAFTSTATQNGFRLGGTATGNGGLGITGQPYLSWRMSATDTVSIYVAIDTADGFRYLYYNQLDHDRLAVSATTIHHGLGSVIIAGDWTSLERDLNADLQDAEPGNALQAVHGVIIRGSMRLDDLRLSDAPAGATPDIVLEDAESSLTENWTIYDADPAGAMVSNLFDTARQSRVIAFQSTATQNGFRLGGTSTANGGLGIGDRHRLAWWMKASDTYSLYIPVDTSNGFRFLYYNQLNHDRLLVSSTTVHHGLGAATTLDSWIGIERDLQADLQDAEPGNMLLAVQGVIVRGSLRIDDIVLSAATGPANLPPTADAGADHTIALGAIVALDGSGSRDDDGTIVDFTWRDIGGSVIASGETADWLPPQAGDHTITLTVTDDRGDSDTDTVQVSVTEDTSQPVVLEDGETADTANWAIYDDTPGGADLINRLDAERQSRVIEFVSTDTLNGFRLGGTSTANGGLDIRGRTFLSFRMTADAPVSIYVAIATSNGFRYLYYNQLDHDRLAVSSTTIHHGLGGIVASGHWLSVERDLLADLRDVEPGNTIVAVHGIIVRGSMSLDDLVLRDAALPSNQPPVADAGSDIVANNGDSVLLDGSASTDPDGTVIAWTWRDAGQSVIASGATATWTPPAVGTHVVTLTVTDDAGATASDTVTVTVSDPSSVPAGYELVFADEFDGSTLDPTRWNTALLWGPYLPINGEEQLYVDTLGMHAGESHDPFELTGSTLRITATPTSTTLQPPPKPPAASPLWHPYPYAEYQQNPDYDPADVNYLSGIITSYGSFRMTHGYVEMRARLPAGQGLWPAFWLLPTHYVEDVPEIDVVEFLGQHTDTVYHTYHYFDVGNNWTKISTPSFTTTGSDWSAAFHTYAMAWTPREIVWYVDGQETRRITDAQYDIAGQSMYLIANLAVGGSWPGSPDASTPFPAALEIDYIRAYRRQLAPELDLAADYQLMFSDEFNGSSLDPAKWKTHFLWGPYLPINNESQYYVDALDSDAGAGPSPFTVANGNLTITARAADDPAGFQAPATVPDANDPIWANYPTFQRYTGYTRPDYTSGIITSYEAFKFSYGYAEMRAKVPKGDGLWPAFWLLNGYYVSQQPEIDVMELRGERPDEAVHSYHHYENGVLQTYSATTDHADPVDGYSDGFHTYGVRWQPGRIDWYIDGNRVHSYIAEDVGYQLMYVIANLAVGGAFNTSPVDPTVFPISLDIDYIRVYQQKDL